MGLIICKWNEKYTGTLEGEEDEGTKRISRGKVDDESNGKEKVCSGKKKGVGGKGEKTASDKEMKMHFAFKTINWQRFPAIFIGMFQSEDL